MFFLVYFLFLIVRSFFLFLIVFYNICVPNAQLGNLRVFFRRSNFLAKKYFCASGSH